MNSKPAQSSAPSIPVSQGTQEAVDRFSGDSLVLFCYEDVRPLRGIAGLVDWRLCGAVSQAIASGDFNGRPGEVLLVPGFGRLNQRRLFVFGLGSASQKKPDHIAHACRHVFDVLTDANSKSVTLAAPRTASDDDTETEFVRAIAEQRPKDGPLVEKILVEDAPNDA